MRAHHKHIKTFNIVSDSILGNVAGRLALRNLSLHLLSVIILSGCSTVTVHMDDTITPAPYSGTNRAFHKAMKSLKEYEYYGEFFVRVIDVPMCLLTDTVILPLDLYNSLK